MTDPLALLEPHQIIRDAGRFADLLDSPIVGILIKRCEAKWFEELKRASTTEALVACRAKANALEDVLSALHEVVSAGEREAIERDRQRSAQPEVSE